MYHLFHIRSHLTIVLPFNCGITSPAATVEWTPTEFTGISTTLVDVTTLTASVSLAPKISLIESPGLSLITFTPALALSWELNDDIGNLFILPLEVITIIIQII